MKFIPHTSNNLLMKLSQLSLLIISFLLFSCNADEELFAEALAENAAEQTEDESDDENSDDSSDSDSDEGTAGSVENTDVEYTDDLEINSNPCDFSIDDVIEPNSTFEIDCQIDLEGRTLSLPANFELLYAGGEIINGTLSFNGGKIDGRLLNYKLEVTGDVQLASTTFQYFPSRWDIQQGVVNDITAQENTNKLEALFFKIRNLGGNRFEINEFDGYFKVDGLLADASPEIHAINLPSDFHLAMTSDVHIRMQPNGHFRPVLMAIYDQKNTTVSGGNLYGDREHHFYDSGFVDSDGTTSSTHEWVKSMAIRGGQNIILNGVSFIEAGVGLSISSIYHYFDSRHIRSKNITISQCKFLRARQTNLVITNAEYVYIEDNDLIDGGIDMANSNGVAPSSNLNIEPFRGRDQTTGELLEYERVSHVFIRNNRQIVNDPVANPSAGSFQLSHGNGPIVVENNEMINTGISFTTVDGVAIRNNTIIEGQIAAGVAGNTFRTDVVYNNEITGNTVVNTNGVGINVAGNGTLLENNSIEGTVGITIGAGAGNSEMGLSNSMILNNNIKASNRGIASSNTVYNVLVEGNQIDMQNGSSFALVLTNEWSGVEPADFIFRGNTIIGSKPGTQSGAPASLLGANSLLLDSNNMGELQINGGNSMIIVDNIIEGSIGSHGIKFYEDAPNTEISGNEITIYSSQTPLARECVFIVDGLNLSNSVTIEGNECIDL